MIHLVYASKATREMDTEALLSMLNQARDRNNRQNLTGMLLYANHCFFQVLEGDVKDVEEVYASIVEDSRNINNTLILKKVIDRREFPNWTMGFQQLGEEECEAIKGYTDFLHYKMGKKELESSDLVVHLLYQFKEANTL